jgi:hypothetical protein
MNDAAGANNTSLNFGFLARYADPLAGVARLAERYFPEDPITCLMKLRQFGELLAKQVAARAGVFVAADEAQSDLLGRLRRETAYPTRWSMGLSSHFNYCDYRSCAAPISTTIPPSRGVEWERQKSSFLIP